MQYYKNKLPEYGVLCGNITEFGARGTPEPVSLLPLPCFRYYQGILINIVQEKNCFTQG